MLLTLTVKNFAIIDNIQVDFKDGMTALTGETGAGKSLIIDAIGLLFGDRASSDSVRNGENKAYIEGVFCKYNKEIDNLLQNLDIECEDDMLIIKREIYANGKSVCKINGETISASNLDNIASYLGDIHTQFDSMKLVNPKSYFSFIDDQKIDDLLFEYKKSLSEYNNAKKEYDDKTKNKNDLLNKLDYMKYQFNELKNAKLTETELDDLKYQYDILNNHGKILENYQEFIKTFMDNNILDGLFNAFSVLEKNIPYNKELEEKVNRIKDSYYDLQDTYEEIYGYVTHDDFDINTLDEVNSRMNLYSLLMKKYNMNISELITYQTKLETEINEFENFDFYIEEIHKKVQNYYNKTKELGKNISELRKQNAKKLEEELYKNLIDLELKNVSLNICVKETDTFLANGINEIDFLVSFNKGEALKSLAKVASGGELSRFMLALKAVSTTKSRGKTYIFDEIDTGVSGEIAQKIGEKIKKISENNQVICVTHLPQVAAISENHLFISKEVVNGRVLTKVTELDYNERINAIALMLSKGEITKATIELAKELLN